MVGFLVHWVVQAVALFVTVHVVSGVSVSSYAALAVAALVIGLVNALVRPVLALLSLPLTLVTLGLFYLVVNGACFALAASLVPGFRVEGCGAAIFGALVMSLVGWLLGRVVARA
jgi:putative membrane protein